MSKDSKPKKKRLSREKKTNTIRTAAIIAVVGNVILASALIVSGIYSSSSALVGAGIDAVTDVLIGTVTFAISGIIAKPADEKHPWGHGRAETVATAFLSFIIFFAGTQLIINSISNIRSGELHTYPSTIAFVVTVIAITGKLLLAWNQYTMGKHADSAMLIANSKNMAGDVLTSVGVLVGLVLTQITGSALADAIVAILIGFWIIKTAFGIFMETNLELMDGSTDKKAYRVIVDSVDAVEGASNPHRARIRNIAGYLDMSFDIDVDPQSNLIEAHSIATKVESEIRSRLDNIFDIMVHIEPRGDETAESYGLSEEEMRGE